MGTLLLSTVICILFHYWMNPHLSKWVKETLFAWFYCRNILSKKSGLFFSSCPPLELCLLPPLPYQFQWHLLCPGLSIYTKMKFMHWKGNLPRQKAVQKLTAALFARPKIKQQSQTCCSGQTTTPAFLKVMFSLSKIDIPEENAYNQDFKHRCLRLGS